jgi:hypothetical protein
MDSVATVYPVHRRHIGCFLWVGRRLGLIQNIQEPKRNPAPCPSYHRVASFLYTYMGTGRGTQFALKGS